MEKERASSAGGGERGSRAYLPGLCCPQSEKVECCQVLERFWRAVFSAEFFSEQASLEAFLYGFLIAASSWPLTLSSRETSSAGVQCQGEPLPPSRPSVPSCRGHRPFPPRLRLSPVRTPLHSHGLFRPAGAPLHIPAVSHQLPLLGQLWS